MTLQTSFLTPPFGFALFYLRSVAARKDYTDRVTGASISAVTTGQIYKGAVAFIGLQLIMVAVIIAFPTIVTGNIKKGPQIAPEQVMEQLDQLRDQLQELPSGRQRPKDFDPMDAFRDQPGPADGQRN